MCLGFEATSAQKKIDCCVISKWHSARRTALWIRLARLKISTGLLVVFLGNLLAWTGLLNLTTYPSGSGISFSGFSYGNAGATGKHGVFSSWVTSPVPLTTGQTLLVFMTE